MVNFVRTHNALFNSSIITYHQTPSTDPCSNRACFVFVATTTETVASCLIAPMVLLTIQSGPALLKRISWHHPEGHHGMESTKEIVRDKRVTRYYGSTSYLIPYPNI
jgi:hypothetical protein